MTDRTQRTAHDVEEEQEALEAEGKETMRWCSEPRLLPDVARITLRHPHFYSCKAQALGQIGTTWIRLPRVSLDGFRESLHDLVVHASCGITEVHKLGQAWRWRPGHAQTSQSDDSRAGHLEGHRCSVVNNFFMQMSCTDGRHRHSSSEPRPRG